MPFINETATIGLILAAGTTNITGNIVATLLLVFAVLFVACMFFGIPVEFTIIVLLPMCLTMGAYYSNLLGPLIAMLIIAASLIAKNWLFR